MATVYQRAKDFFEDREAEKEQRQDDNRQGRVLAYINSTDGESQMLRELRDEKEAAVRVAKYSLALGAMYATREVLRRQRVQQFLRNNITLPYLDESITTSGLKGVDVFGGNFNIANVGIEVSRRLEELSPFSILRTFQISHFLQPFASSNGVAEISGETILAQKKYFQEMLGRHGNTLNIRSLIRDGAIVKNNQLLSRDGEVLVDNVRVVATEWSGDAKHTERSFVNRVLRRHLAATEGYSPAAISQMFNLSEQDGISKLTVIAGESQSDIMTRWVRSAAELAVAQGYRVVNEPFAFMREGYEMISGSEVRGRIGELLGRLKINPEASLDKSIGDLTKGYLKHGAIKTGIAAAGFYALDNVSKLLGGEGSGYDRGIIEGVATSYVNAKLAYAETIGDKLSEMREEQEYVAPKSTSLINLAGLPLAGAMLGGTVAYAQRLGDTAISDGGYTAALNRSQHIGGVLPLGPTTKLKDAGAPIDMLVASRGRRYATRGALAGLLLALPFIPGALVGESSDEIREEYFGDKSVAIRSNRYWFSGSTEYEGQGIKYFARNWYQRLMAGAKDRVLYGDEDTKESLNPFLHPFDYLRNPYRLEEMHKEDMPYPIWGMDVSYGGWAGKLFERTVGQIIKPDVINPEFQKMTEGANQMAAPVMMGLAQSNDGNTQLLSAQTFGGESSGVEILPKVSTEMDIIKSDTRRMVSLVADGLATRKSSPEYNPGAEAFQYGYKSITDFIGIKGWALENVTNSVNILDADYSGQLARSGESTNIAREISSYNAGGLFGAADVMRRIIPMSSSAMYNRNNPMKNSVAPSWLPHDESQYFTDFSSGNYWQSVERGEERLPGVGMEQYYPHLKGVAPEDYEDIDKFRVISDVAYGSKEFYDMSKYMLDRYANNEMDDDEKSQFLDIYAQSQQRGQKKTFYEYKTDEDLEGVSLRGRLLGGLWETVTHNAELPTERLTFFRPAGKLLHQRTAIEDYRKTQILGSDLAMWDSPYRDFIKPFINESAGMFDSDFVPEETQERRNVNDYFDALEYYRQMKAYRESYGTDMSAASAAKRAASKTIRGAIASGLDDEQDISRAYSALSSEEKAYFTSFVNANESDRATISKMVDHKESEMYEMMWRRKDAVDRGRSVLEQAQEEEAELINRNRAIYQDYAATRDAEMGISFAEYLQEQDALKTISAATGIPDDNFIGYDPRIDIKEIKLATVLNAKEDMHGYGFWDSDVANLARHKALLSDSTITMDMEKIKHPSAVSRFHQTINIKDQLNQRGVDVTSIGISNVGFGDINLSM